MSWPIEASVAAHEPLGLAEQAIAAGPGTVAPPSFDGLGWLVALNLATMTMGTLVASMMVGSLIGRWWQLRRLEPWRAPSSIYRLLGVLFACGITIRCGVEALTLWGWDPLEPGATAGRLLVKRLLDPIAVACGLGGLGLYMLSLPGMARQLAREPVEVDLWQPRDMIRRMGWLATLSLLAAVGIVSTR